MRDAAQQMVASRLQQARSDSLNASQESASQTGAVQAAEETATEVVKAGRKGPIAIAKAAATLAFRHRKKIRDGELGVFIVPLTFAISKDGVLDLIPIFGKVFGLFITFYLFVFLWGRGTWKWKVLRTILLLFDAFVPFLSILPFTTFCVAITYGHAKADAEKAKNELKRLGVTT